MKIGDMARLTHCTVETIRYYEKEGLLPPAKRTDSNYRVYGPAHIERLRFIRNCRALDMSHDEIRTLIQLSDSLTAPSPQGCAPINEVFDQHIQHVDSRLQALQDLKAQLLALRGKCQGERNAPSCGILQDLTTHTHLATGPRNHHLS
jgi:Cd(II)/Pb(II)-responsive transcriptional regulator